MTMRRASITHAAIIIGTLSCSLLAAGCAKHSTSPPPAAPTATPITAPAPASTPPDDERVPVVGRSPSPSQQRVTVAVPAAAALQAAAQRAFEKHRGVTDGKNADYIPALAQVDPQLFGITIATANGEVVEAGDARHPFAIESVSKIFTLARVLEDVGSDVVETRIGVNQTGLPFNSVIAIELNKERHPAMNPLVNAGAMTAVTWVKASSPDERWRRIIGTMNAFAGRELPVDEAVYASESATFQHNKGIAYLLKDAKVIQGDPDEALDLYTRQCSVSVTARDLAVMGSTLANGGLNPLTQQRITSASNAARVLAVMATTGLYETTGQWMYDVGVPAKSGVGGGIVAVVPGRFAVAAFSPPLDEAGNSVRAQRAIADVIEELDGSLYGRESTSASNGDGVIDAP